MALLITDISQIDNTLVTLRAKTFALLLSAAYPQLDVSPASAIYQTVILPAAILAAQQDLERQRAIDGGSLLLAATNPTTVDPTTVENLLSNFGLTPGGAIQATGQLRLVVPTNTSFVVRTDVIFTAAGQDFKPTGAFYGVSTVNQVAGASTVLLTPYGPVQADGSQAYSFVITVQAVVPGSAGNVTKDTVFTSTSSQPLVSALAAADFSGGVDTETVSQLLARAATSIATTNLGGRIPTRALLQGQFTGLQDLSTIGANDVEMIRDLHPVFNIHRFGMEDIYVRTVNSPIAANETWQAVHQGQGLWTVRMPRRDAETVIYVSSAQPVSFSTPLPIQQVRRLLDASTVPGNVSTPYFPPKGNDHVFTRYQRIEVDIYDTSGLQTLPSNAPGYNAALDLALTGQTRDYVLSVLTMPQVANIQDFVLSREIAQPAIDVLVKSVFPCLVAISLDIRTMPGSQLVDVAAVQAAVSQAINTQLMAVGQLLGDQIIVAAQSAMPAGAYVALPLDIRGAIFTPDLTYVPADPEQDGKIWLVGPSALTPGQDQQSSPRTISFCCAVSQISVNITPLVGSGSL